MRSAKCKTCYNNIGWVGLVTNTVLMLLKGFVGLVSGSQALVADAMYSAKDVVTSFLVIIGLKVSSKPLDREHPYGHGKIEFVLSMFISIIFMAVTVYLMFHSVQILLDVSLHRTPHLIALWTALLSIAINVVMYFFSRCVVIEVNSPMVRTLAKHHHADASASGLVALGIIGAYYLAMPWIDTVIALLETLHLMYIGYDVFLDAYRGLMDKNTDKKMLARIKRIALATDGVAGVNKLRARQIGQEVSIEITIFVSPMLSVDEAYSITTLVQDSLSKKVDHIGAVHVRFEARLPVSVVTDEGLALQGDGA